MKKFGHTKTLFLQNGKYYKWSYKHSHCTECLNCNHKHKGRGLCTSCWDKERAKKPKRKDQLSKTGRKWHELNYKPVIERKKQVITFTKEKEAEYKKQRYAENKEAMLLKSKVYRRKAKGLPCMQIIINGKTKYLPFGEIPEKPNHYLENYWKKYEEWKKITNELDILTNYYRRNENQNI